MKFRIFFFTILCLLPCAPVNASIFFGAGSGVCYESRMDDDIEYNEYMFPVILKFEAGPAYRDLIMFNSSFRYCHSFSYGADNSIFIYSAGIRFSPVFYFYRSNITKSTFKKNSCAGFLLLPFTAARDAMNDAVQSFIPTHPFFTADFSVIQNDHNFYKGFTASAGLTSGLVDISLTYTQDIRAGSLYKRNIYLAGIEFTMHFPMQKKFIREKSLVE